MMWTYLSPHFDDAAFSCGGLIWEQVQNGEEVIILTVCAGEPPPGALTDYAQGLHARWETGQEAVALRREENKRSCQILGAEEINLTIPDVIYRRSAVDGSPICSSDEELTARLKEDELELLDALMQDFNKTIPPDSKIVSPLALGGHVDHRLTRTAIEKLEASGNVKITFDDKVAVAQKAVYQTEKRVLVLSGPNSKVTSGKDSISGEIITYYRADERIKVESGPNKRVEAVFSSGGAGLK
jgi:LmbE family N-acetylglucosaminyl deacetylase